MSHTHSNQHAHNTDLDQTALVLDSIRDRVFDGVTAQDRTLHALLFRDTFVDRAQALLHALEGLTVSQWAAPQVQEMLVVWMGLTRLTPDDDVTGLVGTLQPMIQKHHKRVLRTCKRQIVPIIEAKAREWIAKANHLLCTPSPDETGLTDDEYTAAQKEALDNLKTRTGELWDALDDMELLSCALDELSALDPQAHDLSMDVMLSTSDCTVWLQDHPYAFVWIDRLVLALADSTRSDIGTMPHSSTLNFTIDKCGTVLDSGARVLSDGEVNELADDAFWQSVMPAIKQAHAKATRPQSSISSVIDP